MGEEESMWDSRKYTWQHWADFLCQGPIALLFRTQALRPEKRSFFAFPLSLNENGVYDMFLQSQIEELGLGVGWGGSVLQQFHLTPDSKDLNKLFSTAGFVITPVNKSLWWESEIYLNLFKRQKINESTFWNLIWVAVARFCCCLWAHSSREKTAFPHTDSYFDLC